MASSATYDITYICYPRSYATLAPATGRTKQVVPSNYIYIIYVHNIWHILTNVYLLMSVKCVGTGTLLYVSSYAVECINIVIIPMRTHTRSQIVYVFGDNGLTHETKSIAVGKNMFKK